MLNGNSTPLSLTPNQAEWLNLKKYATGILWRRSKAKMEAALYDAWQALDSESDEYFERMVEIARTIGTTTERSSTICRFPICTPQYSLYWEENVLFIRKGDFWRSVGSKRESEESQRQGETSYIYHRPTHQTFFLYSRSPNLSFRVLKVTLPFFPAPRLISFSLLRHLHQ